MPILNDSDQVVESKKFTLLAPLYDASLKAAIGNRRHKTMRDL